MDKHTKRQRCKCGLDEPLKCDYPFCHGANLEHRIKFAKVFEDDQNRQILVTRDTDKNGSPAVQFYTEPALGVAPSGYKFEDSKKGWRDALDYFNSITRELAIAYVSKGFDVSNMLQGNKETEHEDSTIVCKCGHCDSYLYEQDRIKVTAIHSSNIIGTRVAGILNHSIKPDGYKCWSCGCVTLDLRQDNRVVVQFPHRQR